MQSHSNQNRGQRPTLTRVSISLAEPRPLLDEGDYVALCTKATVAWSRRWSKWVAKLVMHPTNYEGRPYTGNLCKFFNLGRDRQGPHAGQGSEFRKLVVQLNGDQPANSGAELSMFEGQTFHIEVVTIKGRKEQTGEFKNFAACDWYSRVRRIAPAADDESTNLLIHQSANPPIHQSRRARVHESTNPLIPQPSNPLTLNKPTNPATQLTPQPKGFPSSTQVEDFGNFDFGDVVHCDEATASHQRGGADSNSAPSSQVTTLPSCAVCGSYYLDRNGNCVSCDERNERVQ